jgi:hypothetical protein
MHFTDVDDSSSSRIYQSGSTFAIDVDHANAKGSSVLAFRVDDSERMRIYADGSTQIGSDPPVSGSTSVTGFRFNYGSGFWWSTTGANSYWNTSSGTVWNFRVNGTQVGSISIGSSSTSFNTSGSDSRLKKNFETWDEEVLPYFRSLQPKKFNFTTEDDGTEKTKGYVAQDNVDNFPEAYPLHVNPETNESRYMYNPSGMVVYLMKALQETLVKIETLEAKVAALEAAE